MSARPVVMIIAALVAVVGCGGASARDPETLPGRTRPLLDHTWAHPRDLAFAENRFTPPDPAAALIATPSGLRAYVVTDATARAVQISAAAPLGRGVERSNEIGAADLLSRLVAEQVNDSLGARFMGRVQADQDVDQTRFTIQVLAGDWQPALAALVDALRHPRLDAAAIDAYRTGPGFARQTRGLGGPAFRPAVELSRLLATYPLAPPDPGLGVRREAVRSLALRALAPNALAIGIGGGVTRDAAEGALRSLTAGWQAATAPGDAARQDAALSTTADRWRTIDEPGYTTWIAIGHPMPRLAPADEAAVAVMTDVLNIRLTIAIREIRGLANATQLLVPATVRHAGLLHVRSGARPESIAPIIRLSMQELARIREPDGAPTPEELEQVKGGIVLGKWQGSIDGAFDASATYASETARFGSLDHLLTWPAAVRAVTAQAVGAAAQTYLHPDKMAVVVIGPLDAVRKARHPRWPVALDEVMAGAAR